VTDELRRATDSDTAALYRICLRTAADGADAGSQHADPPPVSGDVPSGIGDE